ncbi:MAG TPA: hypothetical protein VML19_09135 [Verrucomicrobiae bacterium]|nr:hypothetical protein [Verrucomicrobiae bacterium]
MIKTASNVRLPSESAADEREPMHPSWVAFIRFCRQLGHGEIEKLKIQDGLPLTAETIRSKTKFTP